MKDKYTAYAAILKNCGIFFYGSGGLSITPQQMARIFSLLDRPRPRDAILKYLDELDTPGDDEVVEYSEEAYNGITDLLNAEQDQYSVDQVESVK